MVGGSRSAVDLLPGSSSGTEFLIGHPFGFIRVIPIAVVLSPLRELESLQYPPEMTDRDYVGLSPVQPYVETAVQLEPALLRSPGVFHAYVHELMEPKGRFFPVYMLLLILRYGIRKELLHVLTYEFDGELQRVFTETIYELVEFGLWATPRFVDFGAHEGLYGRRQECSGDSSGTSNQRIVLHLLNLSVLFNFLTTGILLSQSLINNCLHCCLKTCSVRSCLAKRVTNLLFFSKGVVSNK